MLDTLSFNPGLPPLMTGPELAKTMRYSGVTSAFRSGYPPLVSASDHWPEVRQCTQSVQSWALRLHA